MARCRGCGAEIAFVRSAVRRRPVPVDAGTCYVVDVRAQDKTIAVVTEDGRVAWGAVVEKVTGSGAYRRAFELARSLGPGFEVGRMSHFATCPVAASFRRVGR